MAIISTENRQDDRDKGEKSINQSNEQFLKLLELGIKLMEIRPENKKYQQYEVQSFLIGT